MAMVGFLLEPAKTSNATLELNSVAFRFWLTFGLLGSDWFFLMS